MATAVELVETVITQEETVILGALAFPIMVVGGDNKISYVNAATEQFLEQGKSFLIGFSPEQIFAKHSPILSLIEQVRSGSISVFEHDIDLSRPRGGTRQVSIQASPLLDGADDCRYVLPFPWCRSQYWKDSLFIAGLRGLLRQWPQCLPMR